MKKTIMRYALMIAGIIGFALIIALSVPVNPASAQSADQKAATGQQKGSDNRTEPERQKGGPLMQLFDTDKNGEISADEIANAPNILKALDKNDDGKLTRDELPGKKNRQGGGVKKTE
jgi:hypothetical protein